MDKIKIRQISQYEILLLENFAPPDWNSNLAQFFSFHYKYNYFYPVVSEIDSKIVGCGCTIKNKTAGWLGNIVVLPEYRCKGIGEKITRHLMNFLDKHSCSIQLLVATKMGEPLYSKLGFKTCSNYFFYKTEKVNQFEISKNIRPIKTKDYKEVKELDRKVSGEERFKFIERFLNTGFVYTYGTSIHAEGFYLPDFGNGLVISRNNQAGLELLQLKLSHSHKKVVIPEANTTARNFLKENSYQEYSVCPRMALSKDVEWEPELIFSRASGYCG